MNDLVRIDTMNLTMSSNEIADLTGKQHKHVLTDIRLMLVNLGFHSAEFSAQYKDSTGRDLPCFNLPKRETLILVSGYDVQIPPKKLFRWMHAHHWIYRRAGGAGWIAYQDRIKEGFLEHKIATIERNDGTQKVCEQVLVTAKGLGKLAMVAI